MRRLATFCVIVFLLLAGSQSAFAVIYGKVQGTVVDATTGNPVAGANVVLEGTRLGSTTDLDGVFFILNIDPGEYELKISYVGFREMIYRIRVNADRTTEVDVRLEPTVIEGEEVIYVAERPMIRHDATDSRTTRTAEDIQMMPVENVREVVRLTAGTVGNNFRGGRASEVSYLVDGVSFVDPMTGNNVTYLPTTAFEEVNVVTGGQSAEYGNFLSGVVSHVTREGSDAITGNLSFRTNDMGGDEVFIGARDRMNDVQGSECIS